MPAQASGLSGVVAVASGALHSVAVDAAGNVWSWGYNSHSQLGDRTTPDRSVPVQVSGLSGVVAVASGAWHSVAVDAAGNVWAWGSNGYGQLGDQTTTNKSRPTALFGLSGVRGIAGGYYHSLFIADQETIAPTLDSVSVTLDGPGTVTSDVDGDGATGTDPIDVTVETTSAGEVTIVEGTSASVSPSGYTMFGFTASITAPDGTASDPLRITFEIDRSLLPIGFTPSAVTMFRNGSPISTCSGSSGPADPDPCIAESTLQDDGDLVVVVLTSQASDWDAGMLTTLLPEPFTVDIGQSFIVPEGELLQLFAALNGETGSVGYEWDAPGLIIDHPTAAEPTIDTGLADDGVYLVTLLVTDSSGAVAFANATIEILNVAPHPGDIVAPAAPVAKATSVSTLVAFTDPGQLDTHSAVWDWGDGTTSVGVVEFSGGTGTVTGSHSYGQAGIHTVSVTISDDDGGEGTAVYHHVVVYDSAEGYVAGSGTVESPAGTYAPAPELSGIGRFAFLSSFERGRVTPSADSFFILRIADLFFQSTNQTVVVTGNTAAMFQGTGTINGEGVYQFRIQGRDGNPDSVRVEIWEVDAAGQRDHGLRHRRPRSACRRRDHRQHRARRARAGLTQADVGWRVAA